MIGYYVIVLILVIYLVWMYFLLKLDCFMMGIRKYGVKRGLL